MAAVWQTTTRRCQPITGRPAGPRRRTGANLGTLNRLTGPVVAAATAAVRTGERVGLTLPLGLPDPPFFGRQRYRHSFAAMGQTAWDDYVDGFYLQCSSQWDGLRHVGSGPDGWYGGWPLR
jgi:hypothetical protein